MIISASRRTDLPAYYSKWFFRRLQEGYVLVRNPVNPRQVSRVSLSPEVVDGFVFWTKNPAPMIPWLDKLPDCPYYFQVTLTPYDEQIERYLPSKRKVILPAVRQLARQIGPERVVWRYDPVFLTERYSVDFHKKAFAQIARLLRGNTVRCVISFLDWYPPMEKRLRPLAPRPLGGDEMRELAASFGQAAAENGMRVFTCAETADLSGFGVEHGCCIDRDLLERIGGRPFAPKRIEASARPVDVCRASILAHTIPARAAVCIVMLITAWAGPCGIWPVLIRRPRCCAAACGRMTPSGKERCSPAGRSRRPCSGSRMKQLSDAFYRKGEDHAFLLQAV